MIDIADTSSQSLENLLKQIRACQRCAHVLPLEPRPILRAKVTARLLVVGQAPGQKVYDTGIPWNDPSGDRLRLWLGLDRDAFYDDARIAIMPMGLCYPGRSPRGGDLPPRPECAPAWFAKVLGHLPRIKTTVLAGAHAQRWYLGDKARPTLTETVMHWQDYAPEFFPLPHPSYRNNQWLKNHPWFEAELLPPLRVHIKTLLGE